MMARSNEEIRGILRGRSNMHVCLMEAGACAVDTSLFGFEDPRSAAVELIIARDGRCGEQRTAQGIHCSALIEVNTQQDTVRTKGACALRDVCAVEIRNNQGDERMLSKQASEEVLAFFCPHLKCDYNYGYTIDGNSGDGGTCMRGIELNDIALGDKATQ